MSRKEQAGLFVSSGSGPRECRFAAAKVVAIIQREAAAMNLECVSNSTEGLSDCDVSSALITLRGAGAEGVAASWTGTVQWTCRSPFRPQHKRQNWFVGVFQVDVEVSAPAELDQRDIRFETFRAGGPGGQHQNKTDSAVRAIHVPTGMTVVSKEERSQFQNKRVAVERLSNRLQREKVEQEAKRRDYENRLQKSLERGNPIRRFRGSAFKAER